MAPCETCREQLLDYLYGLLDDGEKIALEAHLTGCMECQEALDDARRQQSLFNRAAHIVCEVAPFSLPGLVATQASAPSALVDEPPATLPLTAPAKPSSKRSHLRRYWPAWAAAAAILAAVIGLQQVYQSGRGERLQAVAQAKRQIEKVDAQFAAVKDKAGEAVQAVRGDLAEAIHVHAIGPTMYHPAVAAECRVTTKSLDGAPAKADVKIDIVDGTTGTVLYHKKTTSEGGEARLPIPAGLDVKGPAKIRLEAKSGESREVIEETLTPAPRVYATHLALNKNSFHVGEVMFFRTVTLDRVSHEPPTESIPLRVSLINETGKPVVEVAATSGPGGISAGNLALTDELAGGLYTLQVRPEEPGKEQVLAVRQPVEVAREALDMVFDRPKYKAGDTVNVTAWRRATGKGKETVAGRDGRGRGGADDKAEKALDATPYDVRIVVDDKPVPALNAGAYAADFSQKLNADAYGNTLLQFKLPTRIERGAYVELEKKSGRNVERYVQPVPVAPSEVILNFHPEGGNLVPGVDNKIYYRLETPAGAPFEVENFEFNSSKGLVYRNEVKQNWGCFTFTPHGKEKYDVTLKSSALPGGKLDLGNAIDRVAMASDGVALHVKDPVAKAGTPIEVVLRNPGPPRSVLLVAACRGVVFDQQVVTLVKGDNPARIATTGAVDGLLRVTLLEAPGRMEEGRSLVRPLAERLVFRNPERRLDVTCTLDKKGPLNPGESLNADLDFKDETGKHTMAWALGVVVDERVRSPFLESNLRSFFQIASDVARGEDLDQAVLLMNDDRAKDKEATTALDLFLSVHGYRRFISPERAELARLEEATKKVGKAAEEKTTTELKAKEPKDEARSERGVIPLPIFSRESRPLFEERLAFQTKANEGLAKTVKAANDDRVELQGERGRARAAAAVALEELAKYEALPALYGRVALTILFLALLALGGAAILWGAYRWMRATSPRLAFGASIAALACAFGVWFLGRQEVTIGRGDKNEWLVERKYDPFLEPRLSLFGKGAATSTPLGPFVLKVEEEAERAADIVMDSPAAVFTRRLSLPTDAIATALETARRDQDQAPKMRESLAKETAGYSPVPLERLFQTEEMHERFLAAKDVQRQLEDTTAKGEHKEGDKKKDDGKGKKEPAADKPDKMRTLPPPMPGKDDPRKGDEDDNRFLLVREYSYQPFPLRPDFQDTVLWHPALVAENGKARVSFGLSPDVSAYRVLFFAHSPSGRLGFFEQRLEVQPAPARK